MLVYNAYTLEIKQKGILSHETHTHKSHMYTYTRQTCLYKTHFLKQFFCVVYYLLGKI